MPSENPSEPEIAKQRKHGVNQKQKRSHFPRVEPAGTLRRPLEDGMETHSSILAWRIPWTEEPGGL